MRFFNGFNVYIQVIYILFFYAGMSQRKRESVCFLTFSLNQFASLFLCASRFIFLFYFCSAFASLMPLFISIDDFLFSCLLCSPLLVCFEFNIFFYFKLKFSALFLWVPSLSRAPFLLLKLSHFLSLSLFLSPSISFSSCHFTSFVYLLKRICAIFQSS